MMMRDLKLGDKALIGGIHITAIGKAPKCAHLKINGEGRSLGEGKMLRLVDPETDKNVDVWYMEKTGRLIRLAIDAPRDVKIDFV